MRFLLIILLFCFCLYSVGQPKDSAALFNKKLLLNTPSQGKQIEQKIGSATSETGQANDKGNPPMGNTVLNDKNGPWIAALSVGVLTALINLVLSYLQRRSNVKIFKLQTLSSNKLKLNQDWVVMFRTTISDLLYSLRVLYDMLEKGQNNEETRKLSESILKQNIMLALILDKNANAELLMKKVEELIRLTLHTRSGFEQTYLSIVHAAQLIINEKSDINL